MNNNNGNNNKKKLCTAQRKDLFIKYYKEFGTLGVAAKHAGIKSRQTVHSWIKNDPKFAEIYEELKADRTDQLTTNLYLSAMGTLKLTPAQVTSGIFLLKAFDPHQFAEKYQVGGISGEPISLKVVYDNSD